MPEDVVPSQTLSEGRQVLMKAKLGSLLSWTRPDIVETIGPCGTVAFSAFAKRREDLIAQCVDRLQSYSDDEVSIIARNPNDRETVASGWSAFLINEISDLRRQTPPWYADGFGHPDHVADFDYWARMPRFSVSELTCLSIGIAPKEFDAKTLTEFCKLRERTKFLKSIAFLVQRFELFARTFDPHGRGSSVSPLDFLNWVDRFDVSVHPGFIAPLRRFNQAGDASAPGVRQAAEVRQKTDKREIDSIAQLFTALAIDHLGYRPDMARSPIPKEISDLMAAMGMTISEDTIRKYLKIGMSFIDKDWIATRR